MKKKKCIKCGLLYKDREDPADSFYRAQCCWNCSFIIKILEMTIQSFDSHMLPKPLNRTVVFSLDDLQIIRKTAPKNI